MNMEEFEMRRRPGMHGTAMGNRSAAVPAGISFSPLCLRASVMNTFSA